MALTLEQLHKRLGDIIENNLKKGNEFRNHLPIVVITTRHGRRKQHIYSFLRHALDAQYGITVKGRGHLDFMALEIRADESFDLNGEFADVVGKR